MKEPFSWIKIITPARNYMFKVSNRNTRTRCEICSKLTIKTPERRLLGSNNLIEAVTHGIMVASVQVIESAWTGLLECKGA